MKIRVGIRNFRRICFTETLKKSDNHLVYIIKNISMYTYMQTIYIYIAVYLDNYSRSKSVALVKHSSTGYAITARITIHWQTLVQ